MRRIVLTLGGIVALAAPAQALAKVNTLTVKVLGDSNASVTVKVTVGAKGVGRGVVERKVRATGERDELAIADALDVLAG